MKKKGTPKNRKLEENNKSKLNEPVPMYRSVKILPTVQDFSYKKFERIANKVPFTQKEWASILHLSEKTLQRYSKDNKSFEGIYVDRILKMQELIEMGLDTFTSPEAFYRWLKRDKPMLGMLLTFSSLLSGEGIQEHINAIGRMQHGIII
ncbi:MAG: type II RES/Xre toxin-antitoxin system antitoxin [Chitinophagaceae bacterium]